MKSIFIKSLICIAVIFLFNIPAGAQTNATACNSEVKKAQVGGGSIEYLRVGKGSPILLLHGLFAQKEQWAEMACYLSTAGYLVIAPDLPGYATSTHFPLADHKLERQVEILHQLMRSLDIQKFDIAGSSMGGTIASMYSRAYPGQVRSLAFIGAPMGSSGWGAAVRSALYQGINPFIPISNEQFNLAMQLLFYKPPVVPESIQHDLIADYQKSNRWYQQVWDIVNLYLYEFDKASPSPMPTLIIWGKEDAIFEFEDMPKVLQKFPKNRHYVVKEAGHLLMLEHPKTASEIYIQFLKPR